MNLCSAAESGVGGRGGATAMPGEQEQLSSQSQAGNNNISSAGSLSSGSPGSWAPTAVPAPPYSFFRQLFTQDDPQDSPAARTVAGEEVAREPEVSSYMEELLLPPASEALEESSGEHVFGQLGSLPLPHSYTQSASATSLCTGSGVDHSVSNRPHTLEFVDPPFGLVIASSSASEPHYDSDASNALIHRSCAQPSSAGAAKRPKIQAEADQKPCKDNADPSHIQSILNRVNQNQSSRSKEKLGERINALQQLVSPFGKTDTASVLSEAIGYIKFLQDQVQVLSSPYMKPCSTHTPSSHKDSAVGPTSDLRSRGLCLVPVSCTMNVANNNNFNIGADYWASTPNLSSTGTLSKPTRFSTGT
ncbi:hypothetical protein KP509_32G003100 [Ceratopteris richardii]|uniref:BHLH domain-containing protein n=1 Tax=Ceratopteris richardii TaxID=49495 RepID=A0A8T2QRY5_CERRI|nr:hypothetical protein KP509_32G003100 [Ceratopteris richardii]